MTPETYALVLASIVVNNETDPRAIATCGECGRSWDDSVSTSLTPAPSARCPFEYLHGEDDDK